MSKKQGGRPAKPTNLHVLQGTFRTNRHQNRSDEIEVKPFDFEQKPPRELTRDAREHWQQVMEMLRDSGIIGVMDRDGLIMYCETWVKWVESNMNVERYGIVIKKNNGKGFMLSPYFTASLKLADMMRRLLSEYGMSPVSRIGMKSNKTTVEETEKDGFDGWLDKYNKRLS